MSCRDKKSLGKENPELFSALRHLPQSPGVYQFFDKNEKVIYVGKSRNLRKRVNSYFDRKQDSVKTRQLVKAIARFEFTVTGTESEALLLECNLIKHYSPRYNVLFKDGKSYPFLKLWQGFSFPYVEKVRKVVNDGAKYYGPFAQEWKVNQILKFIDRHYKLIKCRTEINEMVGKPCLDFQIGRCDGPCFQEIDQSDYAREVEEVKGILEGNYRRICKDLTRRMEGFSRNLQFELAARMRDQIESLEILQEEQVASGPDSQSYDVVAMSRVGNSHALQHLLVRSGKIVDQFKVFVDADHEGLCSEDEAVLLMQYLKQHYLVIKDPPREICLQFDLENLPERPFFSASFQQLFGREPLLTVPLKGRKKRLLELAQRNSFESLKVELRKRKRSGSLLLQTREALGLAKTPYRVECFDISNTSGAQATASMVVAIHGKMESKEYRKFKIRSKSTPDDYEMMREVIRRRYSKVLEDSRKSAHCTMPDLVMVDGGIGQLHAAGMVFEELGVSIDVASLAKREELIYVLGTENQPLQLGKHSPVRLFFQEIRDEAHRFAITYHRTLRGKASIHSLLDEVSGVGPKRKSLILKAFPDLKVLIRTDPKEVAHLGIPIKVARELIETCKSSLLFL
jgi:excinuclease ABC subunit C